MWASPSFTAKTRHMVLKPPCPGFQPSLSPCCLPTPGPGGPEPNSGEPQACVAGEVTSVSQAKQFWLPSPRKLTTWGIANWPPLADGEGSTDPPWEPVPHQSGLSFSVFTPKVLSRHLVVQKLRSCLTSMGSRFEGPEAAPWRLAEGAGMGHGKSPSATSRFLSWVADLVSAPATHPPPGPHLSKTQTQSWCSPAKSSPHGPGAFRAKETAPHDTPAPSQPDLDHIISHTPRDEPPHLTQKAHPVLFCLTNAYSAFKTYSRLTFLWSLSPFLALSSLLSTFPPPPWLTSVSFTFPLIGYKDTQLTLNLRWTHLSVYPPEIQS